MAWERRGNHAYYYRGVRIGGKVRKVYLGKGSAADFAMQTVEYKRERRTAAREAVKKQREPYHRADVAVEGLSKLINLLTKAQLVVAGMYLHHGEWRRRSSFRQGGFAMPQMAIKGDGIGGQRPSDAGSVPGPSAEACSGASRQSEQIGTAPAPPPDAESSLDAKQEFKLLVARANSGDTEAIQLLHETLDANPQIWQHIGDLAAHAEQSLVRLIAKEDQLLAGAIERKLTAMKAELLGENSLMLEKLAVERIVACWCQVQYADSMAVSAEGNHLKFWANEQARSDRRYQAALKQLLNIRQLIKGKLGAEKTAATAEPRGSQSSSTGGEQVEGILRFAPRREAGGA